MNQKLLLGALALGVVGCGEVHSPLVESTSALDVCDPQDAATLFGMTQDVHLLGSSGDFTDRGLVTFHGVGFN